MEKIIHEQINTYILRYNVLFYPQSGLRRSYSTETYILYLTDHKFSEMFMSDLQKAFDTVDHAPLLLS